ncbi:MAG: DUF2191 domain-containing protein [Acidobacteria bacterium]|nr:MAG: DUF2191 domain-containing protein [Acidobacteriota bacterium]
MRTTIRIDDQLLTEAKKRALESGRSLTAFLEEAVRNELSRNESQRRAKPFKVKEFHGTGLLPGVDLDDTADLLDRMESR